MDKHTLKEHTVVAMSDYQPETGFAALAQVEAYWEALRGNRVVPRRSDIDPRGIEHALKNAFIVERLAPGIARLRIAGAHLSDIMGMEVRGMPLSTFFTPNARAQVADVLEDVCQSPAKAQLRFAAPESVGRPALEGRMVLLPLKSDLGDVSRILGCLVCKGEIGVAPRRFALTHKMVQPIAESPFAGEPPAPRPRPTRRALPPQEAQRRGMAEDAAAFEHESGSSRRPPYLRLVKSDE